MKPRSAIAFLWISGLAALVLAWLPLSAHAQSNQCRTSPVGASTSYCASEAFVTNSAAASAPGGSPGQVQYNNSGTFGGLTNAQLTALINPATASLSGALPAWPNNTTTFFRGDGTYDTLNFAALSGNINVSQMNSGTGASGSTFWRGDGTWAVAGTGTVTSIICDGGTVTITTTGTCASREVLTGNRTYFVGANLGAPTISIASPAVVTLNAHGLQANDPVVFQVPQNRTAATISAANPGVVTMANTFAAGQPIQFYSTGDPPGGLAQATTYYVIAAGLSSTQFEFSTTPGGSAVNTTALTNTFVNGNATVTTSAAHNLVVGQIIQFAGTSVVNVSNATNYVVISTPLGTTFTFGTATAGNIVGVTPGAVTTQGNLAQTGSHIVSSAGSLPTGITEGTEYFVIAAGLTANAFEVSATSGGSAVNTSGSVTGTPVYSVYTGNDSNTGLAQTRAGAFLTMQKAINATAAIDLSTFSVTIQIGAGTYTGTVSVNGPWVGTGNVTLTGSTTTPSDFLVSTSSGFGAVAVSSGGRLRVQGIKLVAAANPVLYASNDGSILLSGNTEFGSAGSGSQITTLDGGQVTLGASYQISGGGAEHYFATGAGSTIRGQGFGTVTVYGVPAFSSAFTVGDTASAMNVNADTYTGSAKASRYAVTLNAVVNTGGGGANYFPGNSAGTTATGGQYN